MRTVLDMAKNPLFIEKRPSNASPSKKTDKNCAYRGLLPIKTAPWAVGELLGGQYCRFGFGRVASLYGNKLTYAKRSRCNRWGNLLCDGIKINTSDTSGFRGHQQPVTPIKWCCWEKMDFKQEKVVAEPALICRGATTIIGGRFLMSIPT